MALISEEEYIANPEHAKEYCEWCWGNDYGRCDLCAVDKHRKDAKKDKEED